jgi:hypothetical protein
MITAGKITWISDKVPSDKGMALGTVTSFNRFSPYAVADTPGI